VRKHAFTLIETLVAMAILSFLLIMILDAHRTMLSTAKRTVDLLPERAMAYGQLRTVINAAYPYQISQEDGTYKPLFRGDEKRVEFVTEHPLLSREVALVRLEIREGVLYYQEQPVYHSQGHYGFKNPTIREENLEIPLLYATKMRWYFYHNQEVFTQLKGVMPQRIELVLNKEKERAIYFVFGVRNSNYRLSERFKGIGAWE